MIRAKIGAPAPPVREVPRIAGTSQRAHRDGINAPGGSRLLLEREIVRALLMFRYDRRRRVPIKALAEACQLHRSVLYDVMQTGRVSERARAVLSGVIGWIVDDRLRFRVQPRTLAHQRTTETKMNSFHSSTPTRHSSPSSI
jgi:hypothetical protein